ncbi:NDR1/HIN1-like protein 10 [Senna tora]|uniref:NDR1/HIN1-like protein 10 n=1 Tax=Senna tora TaxID=362788 RepID=A0A834WIL9_9FABA|nr:NDR1/HIN1-like protein 10 [Senna tora]
MACRPRCSFCCIFCTFYSLFIIFFFSIIIFFIIFHPSNVKFYVTEASLTQFNLSSNNTLSYNFRVNITVRNPNKHITVSYRSITAIAWYKKRAFAWVSLAPFVQGQKNTSILQPAVFEGQRVIPLKPRHVAEYNKETQAGVYENVVVDLDVRVKAKYGRIKGVSFRPPVVQCRLRVPLVSNGTSASPFNVTKCGTGYFFADRDSTA